jgi:hypothetical protein
MSFALMLCDWLYSPPDNYRESENGDEDAICSVRVAGTGISLGWLCAAQQPAAAAEIAAKHPFRDGAVAPVYGWKERTIEADLLPTRHHPLTQATDSVMLIA